MSRKKNINPENTRDAIIQAAYDSFLKNGFHGTSMREIACRAGLTVAAAYNHFQNKDDLYVSVLTAHHPYVHVLPALAQADGDTIEEFLGRGARLMIEALDRDPGFLKLMFIEIVEFDNRHVPLFFRDVMPQLMAFAQSISRRKGRLRPFPLPVLVRSFAGLFFSYYITELLIWKFLPPAMQVNCFNEFVDIYLHGVLEPAPARAG